MFMFRCLYKLIWTRIQHHLLQIQSPLCRPCRGSLRPPHSHPSPSTLPSGSGSIMSFPSPRTGEENSKAPSSPSPTKRRQRTVRRSFPLCRRCRCCRPHLTVLLLLLLPSPPMPFAQILMCIVALPGGLVVVSLLPFVPPRSFRVASAVPLRRWSNFCWIPGLFLREVDCYVTCDLGAIGLRRKL